MWYIQQQSEDCQAKISMENIQIREYCKYEKEKGQK